MANEKSLLKSFHNSSLRNVSDNNNLYLSKNLRQVRILDIILDSTHDMFNKLGGYDSIGTIFWGDVILNKNNEKRNDEYIARPLFHFLKQYPLKNEVVLLVEAPSKQAALGISGENEGQMYYYFPNVNIWNHQHNNAFPDMRYYKKDEAYASNYGTLDGQPIRNPDDNSVEIPLGNYFTERLDIQPLLPFEGDTIIEGRFGNSIRFGATAIQKDGLPAEQSAYSTKGKTGDPITIIRNGALVEEEDNGWEHTLENINTDHSAIYLTSNQILPNFEIVTPNWDSWLVKHDALDVGDAKDDYDNILRGEEPEVIEIQETPEEKDTSNNTTNNQANDELENVTEDNSEEFPKETTPETYKFGWNEDNRTEISLDAQDEEPGEWDPNAENNNESNA
tara:strand:- start:3129 stop:4304 length:1176 start_codon:yes stop_codon:yes gene_type:complete